MVVMVCSPVQAFQPLLVSFVVGGQQIEPRNLPRACLSNTVFSKPARGRRLLGLSE